MLSAYNINLNAINNSLDNIYFNRNIRKNLLTEIHKTVICLRVTIKNIY